MKVGNFPAFIKTPFRVNLSDMNHITRQSAFSQVVAQALNQAIYDIAPVGFNLVVFLIGQDWQRACCERDAILSTALLDEKCTLSQRPCAQSGQTLCGCWV